MTSDIQSAAVYQRLDEEIKDQQHCKVTLTLQVHEGKIVRWAIERLIQSKPVARGGQTGTT